MSENQNEANANASEEIERLRSENAKLKEEWLELSDQMLSFTGLPGHLHRLDQQMKELKSLLIRAADALDKGSSDTDSQLVQELRKASE
jgi:uncharacterized protein YukE